MNKNYLTIFSLIPSVSNYKKYLFFIIGFFVLNISFSQVEIASQRFHDGVPAG